MKWMRRLGIGLAVLAVVAVAGVAGGWLWLRTGLPPLSGRWTIAGLSAQVEIIRDAEAVPHIFAETEQDAYFALGWLHAQDRLWQMEMQRRLGAGRLAEVIGAPGLRPDRMMRTLGLYRRAEASLEALSPDFRRALDSYAAGVNAWLAARGGPLPVEFQLLRITPEPWRPADSLVWGKLMALQLGANMRRELLNARMARELTVEQVRDLDPDAPRDWPTTLAAALDGIDFAAFTLDGMPSLGPSTASNEWVLAGSQTATGKPILANDPHLGLGAPVLWYLARIEAPGLSLTGGTVPGAPLHLLGHNGKAAWGLTTTGGDVQDLFVERLDPGDPGRYLTPTGSEPFATRTETIRLADGSEETLTVRETRHGPVVSDLDIAADPPPPEGHVLALAWTGLSERDTTAEAIFRLNRAGSWDAFRDALRIFQAPQQNFAYADAGGTIGFVAAGTVPVRRAGDGTAPVPGWTGEFDWTGTIPFDALPQGVNPPSGSFVNANNRVVGPGYPHLIAREWDDGWRAARIEQVLGAGRNHALADSERLLADTLSLPALLLQPLLTRTAPRSDRAARALALLRDWDGRMDRNRPEPLIFDWWLRELNRALYADETGELFGALWQLRPSAVARMLTERQGWCDDQRSVGTVETCAAILSASLETTLDALAARHGPNLAAWRWGLEHRAALENQVLARVPVLGRLYDIGVETDGGNFTVNRGAFVLRDEAAPFAHTHGAGYRAVYDLADLSRSLFVIATGQSGNPLSPHYADFVGRWAAGRHVTIAGSREALAARGQRTLLIPEAP
ncbi:penicillin acylase family protein [Arenibaculum pallidiluteum]|uniref:penicillin acylase family protein n=1 Tax=Arenibaculum pallidiluteum TaxID=2812559 RepID=UPI001A9699A6|nr:penicillin acylase family protein [Arenibaculum pallidiluteum]